jgi:CubicO group peptidase (beta-lactamase class C family)
VWFKGAWGQASKDFDIPNKVDTKFNLGSINKSFTAVAIAQLAERGKLSLADPVSKYLGPDWLPREVADKITIEHLLTHTAGLGSYFNDTFMAGSRERFRVVDDYKPLVERRWHSSPAHGTRTATRGSCCSGRWSRWSRAGATTTTCGKTSIRRRA